MALPGESVSSYVERPELLRRLDQSLRSPLTLITAQAGSGKSVLLSQWTASHPDLTIVRVNLEVGDNDPVRFIRRLLVALAAVDATFAELRSLAYTNGGGLGTPLIDGLAAMIGQQPELILAFDDVHRLSNSALLADLGRLIYELPPSAHVVLSSRVDPPFALGRYRLHQEMVEVRQGDLAFDELDSTKLLSQLTGRSLGSDQIQALQARTEGWVAGLQLAGITLKSHPNPDDFIIQFSGNDRLVADFLGEEVLQALPDDQRALLCIAAVPDQISAELLRHLTGEARAQILLDQFERDSLFLVRVDGPGTWFRFHPMFRDLLRYRFRSSDPLEKRRLLAAAAAWHIDRGQLAPAITYLLRASEWERALATIMSFGPKAFEQGEMATITAWLDQIPEGARANRVDVTLLRGIFEGITGNAVKADDVLRPVALSATASAGERACALAFLATLVQWRPGLEESLRWAELAKEALASLEGAPVPDLLGLTNPESLEAITLAAGGRAKFFMGEFPEARRWLREAKLGKGSTYSIWRIHLLGTLGLIEAWSGRTERAVSHANEAIGVALAAGIMAHPGSSDAFLALSLASLERGERATAVDALEQGLMRATANRRTQLQWVAGSISAMLLASEGRPDDVATHLTATSRRLGAPPPPIVANRLLALQANALRSAGFPERALRIMGVEPPGVPALAFERVAAYLTIGHVNEAAKELDVWPVPEDPARTPLAAVERLTMAAWVAAARGRTADADQLVDDALALAEPHCLVDVFARAGGTVVDLLAERPDAQSGFTHRVLDRAMAVRSPSTPKPLADPLTKRELAILAYLPTRLRNAEIAERCYLSLNTVKTHLARIYRKLGVANRNEAIVRAREFGLIDATQSPE